MNKWNNKIDGLFVNTKLRSSYGTFDVSLNFNISVAPGIATHFEPKFLKLDNDILGQLKRYYGAIEFETYDLPQFLENYIQPRRQLIYDILLNANLNYLTELRLKFS